MNTKIYHFISVCMTAWILTGSGTSLAGGSDNTRNKRVSDRQQTIAMDYFNRNQRVRLYHQMLTDAGYQAGSPSVVFTSEDCGQNICTDYFEVRRSYAGTLGPVELAFGVGIRKNFQYSFVFGFESDPPQAVRQLYLNQHYYHGMGGDDISYALVEHFREQLPNYLADNADYSGDEWSYLSLRSLTCVGPLDFQDSPGATCIAETLDGDKVTIDGDRAGWIYAVLHSPDMTSTGVFHGRDVLVLDANRAQISVPYIACTTASIVIAGGAGNCDSFHVYSP